MKSKSQKPLSATSFVFKRSALCLSLLAWIPFCMSPDIFQAGDTPLTHAFYNIFLSWKPFTLDKIILFPALFFFFLWCDGTFPSKEWKRLSIIFPSALFSLSMVFGNSYARMDSWWLALEWRNGQIIKSIIFFSGYYIFSSRFVATIYFLLNRMCINTSASCPPVGWYGRKIKAHPFCTIFLTMFICYIPHLLISAPALLMGDTWGQIVQAYPAFEHTGTFYILPEQMLDQKIYINQSHPVVHTLLLHFFLVLGNKLHSMNFGLLLYSIFQLSCICGSIALVSSDFLRLGLISNRYYFVFPIYGFLHPMIYNYSTLITKDVLYAVFTFVFIAELLLVIIGQSDKKTWFKALLSGCGALVFRNEARIPVLLGCLIGFLICKKQRNIFIKVGAWMLAFSVLCFNIIFPAFKFTSGSRREIMSVPFQQVARYVRDYGDDITDDEAAIISQVLNYSSLSWLYDPNISDPVKATFNERATAEDLQSFFQIWLRLFLRHPDAYFQSWLNNYYEFLYPESNHIYRYTYDWSDYSYSYTDLWLGWIDQTISPWDVTAPLRSWADGFLDALNEHAPIFSFLSIPALYTYLFLLSFGFAFRCRNRQMISLLSFPMIMISLCFMNPCNGSMGRYYLPEVYMVPLLIPILRSCWKMQTHHHKDSPEMSAEVIIE